MKIVNKIRKIKKSFSSHQTLIKVFVSSKNIIHNLNEFKRNYPDIARLGLGLYGFSDHLENKVNLKPALSVETVITSVRQLNPGDCIGYGATFKARQKIKAATIPFGYFEGFNRRLFNKGFVKIKNTHCPVLGKISMNITSFDISAIPEAEVGDKITVISQNPKDKNSVSKMAEMSDTIPYVILIHIPEHLKRIII